MTEHLAVDYAAWIGRERISGEAIDPKPSRALAATLGLPEPTETLPPCWTWLHHLDVAPRSRMNSDGHPITGNFLPPIPAKRRMFAGASLRFHRPVAFGVQTTLRERVTNVEAKQSKSGYLRFVTVNMQLASGEDLLVEEDRTIAYLGTRGSPRQAALSDGPTDWRVTETPDAAMLFRFSALTFNAHRIHYDLAYATDAEGYPERVIHGPLQAILLANAAADRAPSDLTAFRFRGTAPAFLGETLSVSGTEPADGTIKMQITAPDGTATTVADAQYAFPDRRPS